jgi:hypothetical protein
MPLGRGCSATRYEEEVDGLRSGIGDWRGFVQDPRSSFSRDSRRPSWGMRYGPRPLVLESRLFRRLDFSKLPVPM